MEPNRDNLVILKRNLGSMPGVRCLKAALSDVDGECEFESAASNTGHLKGRPASRVVSGTYRVTTCRIATVFPRDWDPSKTWMKLDIEGAEYEVIADMLRCGLRPSTLNAELHDFLNAGGEAVVENLRSAGYRVSVTGLGNEGEVCRQMIASKE